MYKYSHNSNINIYIHKLFTKNKLPAHFHPRFSKHRKIPPTAPSVELRVCRAVDFEMPFPIPSATLGWVGFRDDLRKAKDLGSCGKEGKLNAKLKKNIEREQ